MEPTTEKNNIDLSSEEKNNLTPPSTSESAPARGPPDFIDKILSGGHKPTDITEMENIRKNIQSGQVLGKGGYGQTVLSRLTMASKTQKLEDHQFELDIYLKLYKIVADTRKRALKNLFADVYFYDNDPSHPVIHMEFLQLFKTLTSDPANSRNPKFIRDCFKPTFLTIVAFNHHFRYSHQDIKPHNLGISKMGNIKLFDFGLSVPLGEQSTHRTANYYPFHLVEPGPGGADGPKWVEAPEFKGKKYITKVKLGGETLDASTYDLFSFGVMLFTQIFNKHPFRPVEEKNKVAYMDAFREFNVRLRELNDNVELTSALESLLLITPEGGEIDGDKIVGVIDRIEELMN